MNRKLMYATAGCAAAVLTLGLVRPATGATYVANWEMNEPAGATVATDSSGHQLHGRVGDDVQTGVDFGSNIGFRFPYISGSSPQNLEHIVEVAENDLLDPGSGKFTVSLRFRSNQSWGNLVQKGQAGMTGGFWKVDISKGILTCMFRDENGLQSTASSRTTLNDGRWHTIRCVRSTSAVVLYVDGEWRETRNNPTGTVNNKAPLTIAGKRYCGSGVQCDYWFGDMDYVRVSVG